jgi:hypothetical protein
LPPHELTHDEQTQAEARHLALDVATGPVEALEDLAELGGGDADAAVGDLHLDAAVVLRADRHRHLDGLGGVLDGVLEQVAEDEAELFAIAAGREDRGSVEPDRLGREPVPGTHLVHASGEQLRDVDTLEAGCPGPTLRARRRQDLVDGALEAGEVLAHLLEEALAPLRRDAVPVQGVHEEPERGQGRLHLVGDTVEEVLLALVEAHLAHQPDADQQEAGDEQREEEPAEDEQHPVHPGEPGGHRTQVRDDQDLPAHRQGHGHAHEDDADRERQADGASLHLCPPHGSIATPDALLRRCSGS